MTAAASERFVHLSGMISLPTLPPFPTVEEIQTYVWSLEHYVPLPADVANAVQQLYHDLSRFGPPAFPELPGLSSTFERFVQVPAPPPPPPPKVLSLTSLSH